MLKLCHKIIKLGNKLLNQPSFSTFERKPWIVSSPSLKVLIVLSIRDSEWFKISQISRSPSFWLIALVRDYKGRFARTLRYFMQFRAYYKPGWKSKSKIKIQLFGIDVFGIAGLRIILVRLNLCPFYVVHSANQCRPNHGSNWT